MKQRACLTAALLCTLSFSVAAESRDYVFTEAPRVADPPSQQLLDITQAGTRLVAVGASGLIVVSDDAGTSWVQVASPVSATLTAVTFAGPREGWAVGHAGVILHSDDAGESWSLQFDGRRAIDAFLAYASGQRRAAEDALAAAHADEDVTAAELEALTYALDDAAFIEEEAQLAVETGPADPFLDVLFFDERRGLAVGAYGMSFATADGGENWTVNQLGIENPDRFHLYGLYSDAAGRVVMAGEAGLLYRSEDGGEHFERFFDVYDGSLFGVVPWAGTALSFGLRGNLFAYDAAQGVWQEVVADNDASLYGGAPLDGGGALLVGAGGVLLRLAPDGRAQRYQHPSRSTFSAALQASDGVVWLVGMDGLARLSEAHAR
ncbi:MAG: YCF48-related protein [Pseudomonadales bacterium]|nr:YCF48-related protein [Pseudomonadales bacterium]